MKFEIGQRIRYTGKAHLYRTLMDSQSPACMVPTGALGIVIPPHPLVQMDCYTVLLDLYPSPHPLKIWNCSENQIEPLADGADYQRFMERVMKPVDVHEMQSH